MSTNEINESLNLTLTISILLATSINFFMDKSIFMEGFPKYTANWYGLTIIFLLLIYIFFYSNKDNITLEEIKVSHKLIMINLSFMIASFFFIMYPKIIDTLQSIIVIVICITTNLLITGYILSKLIIKTYKHNIK